MNDQCKHCTAQGDMPACINTPCSQHASWFAKAQSAELSRAYALIEEMREASKRSLSLATAWSEYYQAKHKLDAVHPTHEAVIEYVRDVTARADAFLAERVK